VHGLSVSLRRGCRRRGSLVALLIAAMIAVACGGGHADSATASSASSSSTSSSPAAPAQATSGTAAKAKRGVKLVRIGNFNAPTYAVGPPGDTHRLFVVQKAGQIMVVVNGHTQPRPFLDIHTLVTSGGTEQGLLSLAFAPDYQHSGRFYVAYTISDNDVRIAEYRRQDPNRAAAGSGRIVLTVHHHYANHNGGQLAFGPDGDLYIGIGDGGNENDPQHLGQNTGVLDGKILRIQPGVNGGYTVPKSNPFVGQSGKRPEIWAYGLRNPWRFSFDRRTGDLIIGDVGQDKFEEIDFARRGTGRGANYGWSIFEGRSRFRPGSSAGMTFPVLVLPHTAGYCAVIGGYVVRDRSLPSLYGRYLFGDDCKPQINSVKLSEGHATDNHATGLSVPTMSSFGQDAAGHIYAVSLRGPVYRLTAK
jgi:glucose/arabinose dehydrogenase